ncbi:MAG: permease-like cell division protein FtsX [Lachnospiraceae bacterium]|nr:permease-like cell division protein FtsX [Lachnospiraceae bacterium]
MKISTFFYSLKQGIINIKRNKLYSLASIGTITACIFLIGLFYAVVINLQHIVKNAEEQVNITVFFEKGIEQERIDEIGEIIKKRVEVESIEFTSAEEAWNEFKKLYFGDKEEMAEGFKSKNPLANSASYTVFLNDLEMQDTFVSYMESVEGVRQVNYSSTAAGMLTDFGRLIGLVSAAIIIILLGVGIFLISNTVMIGITVRKEEIGIMKLMGATDYFVRAPFLVEGIVIGLVGAAIPIVILFFIYREVVGYIIGQFQSISTIVNFISVNEVFKILIPMALIIGAGIGVLGSMITIRKHLKV